MNVVTICSIITTLAIMAGVTILVRRGLRLADDATRAAGEASAHFAKSAQNDIDSTLKRFRRLTTRIDEIEELKQSMIKLKKDMKLMTRNQAPAVASRLERVENRLSQVEANL